MSNWNIDNKVELRYFDTYGVKNKLRQLIFNKPNDLQNILKAYEIINAQQSQDPKLGKIILNSCSTTQNWQKD